MYRIILIVFLLCTVSLYSQKKTIELSKKERSKISNMIVFDFITNFDLSLRNKELSIVNDFIPSFNEEVNKVTLKTNIADKNTIMIFTFGKKNRLKKIHYNIDNVEYEYEYVYDKGNPIQLKMNGEIIYRFVYAKKKIIKVLHYKDNEVNVIFNLKYIDKLSVLIKFKTASAGLIDKGKNYIDRKITWNYDFKITSFELIKYRMKSIKYNEFGNIKSFLFDDSISMPQELNWKYNYDNKNNWIRRTSKSVISTRKIEYKK